MTHSDGPHHELSPEAREELASMSASQIETIRETAKNNLFFLAQGVLGYDQVQEETHDTLCAFLQSEPSPRKLVLMPRGHLKSTIATISRSIQCALRSPDTYRCLIASANATKAESFLTEIKAHWERGEMLRALFPELVPEKLSGPGSDWSMKTASIERHAVFKESTWSTVGAGGAATSQHYSHIIPDDIIDEQHKQSRADMERVKTWNRSLEELLDNQDQDEICWVGTRKTMDDVYADIMEIWEGELAVFIREPIENGKPIFPLKFSMERFMRIMEKKPEEWAHDYMNNPVGKGGIDWGKAALRDYRFSDDGERVVFLDPDTREIRSWRIRDLDIVITCDPNSGQSHAPDKAAIVVHGVSPRSDVFVLSSWSGRPSPWGYVELIYETCVLWNPRVVGIEQAGQQNTLMYFEKLCSDKDTFFKVVPLEHKNRDKDYRIRTAIDPLIKSRRLYTLPTQLTLRGQLPFFPQLSAHNRDEIDCLGYGAELYREGAVAEDVARAKEAEKRILQSRGLTGYGRTWQRADPTEDPEEATAQIKQMFLRQRGPRLLKGIRG